MAKGTVVDRLLVEIRAETAQLQKDLKKMEGQLSKAEKKGKGLGISLKGVATALAAVGGVQALRSLVATTRQFEDLQATLKALTGSAEGAGIAFEIIKDFTATTTFQLQGVTQGFITFLQAGIIPTQDALRDFGNLAAAFDKDISVLAQAVFRAMTGEMEMLKQFNVIMKVEGDKFKATFDGVTTEVDRNGEAIAEYIQGISRTNFPTALEDRANTLTGAISNLEDAFAMFQFQIGQEFKPVLVDIARNLTVFFQESDRGAQVIGDTLAGAFRALEFAVKNIHIFVAALKGAFLGLIAAQIITGIGNLIKLMRSLRTATQLTAVAESVYLAIKTRGVSLLATGAVVASATAIVTDQMTKATNELNDSLEDEEELRLKKIRDETRLAQIVMKSLSATQLYTKTEMAMITTLRELTKTQQDFSNILNTTFGFKAEDRLKRFNKQLEIMRTLFKDQIVKEALFSEGAVKRGDIKEIPASELGFMMDFTDQETINSLNANKDIMTKAFLDVGLVDARIIVKEVEKDGEMIVEGFIRGIDAEQYNLITGEDRFAQYLGFDDKADMDNFSQNLLPIGNVQQAMGLFIEAINTGMGDLESIGLSEFDPFAELRFLVDPENTRNLIAFKDALIKGGFLPEGAATTDEGLQKIREFIEFIIAEGDRAAMELSPLAEELFNIADAAKNPAITFEDFTDEVLNNKVAMQELFDEIIEKYPQAFASFEEFVEFSKKGVEDMRETVESASELFSGELLQSVVSATNSFSSEFARSLLEGESALESFKNFAKNIVSQIIAIFIQMAIVNKIINSIFGLKPGMEGYQPELNVFGEKASGGRMQRGQPYLVGERGAELFVPDASGSLMNNMNTKGAMNGQTVVINQSLNFSTGVQQTVRAEVMGLMPQITEASKQAVSAGALRGGNFKRSLRGA